MEEIQYLIGTSRFPDNSGRDLLKAYVPIQPPEIRHPAAAKAMSSLMFLTENMCRHQQWNEATSTRSKRFKDDKLLFKAYGDLLQYQLTYSTSLRTRAARKASIMSQESQAASERRRSSQLELRECSVKLRPLPLDVVAHFSSPEHQKSDDYVLKLDAPPAKKKKTNAGTKGSKSKSNDQVANSDFLNPPSINLRALAPSPIYSQTEDESSLFDTFSSTADALETSRKTNDHSERLLSGGAEDETTLDEVPGNNSGQRPKAAAKRNTGQPKQKRQKAATADKPRSKKKAPTKIKPESVYPENGHSNYGNFDWEKTTTSPINNYRNSFPNMSSDTFSDELWRQSSRKDTYNCAWDQQVMRKRASIMSVSDSVPGYFGGSENPSLDSLKHLKWSSQGVNDMGAWSPQLPSPLPAHAANNITTGFYSPPAAPYMNGYSNHFGNNQSRGFGNLRHSSEVTTSTLISDAINQDCDESDDGQRDTFMQASIAAGTNYVYAQPKNNMDDINTINSSRFLPQSVGPNADYLQDWKELTFSTSLFDNDFSYQQQGLRVV